MADKLYIIGNGFDLHHGMRTSYANFRDDYASKKPMWFILEAIYGDIIREELFWWNFEEMLSCVDYQRLLEPMYGKALVSQKVKNFLSGQLPSLFENWILQMKKDAKQDETLGIDKEDMFFTFNYTLLLENVYHIKDTNVWHIHGSIKDREPIMVGHDASKKDLAIQLSNAIETNPELRRDIADEIMKETVNGSKHVERNILLNDGKFDQYADIKHFVAMGFSFNKIDMPYIKKICEVNKNIKNTDWTLYYYSVNEKDWMKEKVKEMGVKEENISTIEWKQL